MQLRILKPGLLSSIQDLGRTQFLADAVPVSGAMDTVSARTANLALGNPQNCATLEFNYSGSELFAETDLLIAFSGEGAEVHSDHTSLPQNRPLFIPAGKTLKLIKSNGCRTYLAIAGGWSVPQILGSGSTYLQGQFGGYKGRCLQENDLLFNTNKLSNTSQTILNTLKADSINFPSWSIARSHFLPFHRHTIRLIPGREFTWFKADSLLAILGEAFKVSRRSNRMAYHLEGPQIIRVVKDELLSTAVTPGTIQVTGEGKMLLLMADCQTTGGYPRIAQVAAVDLPLCGQLKPGDEIYFEVLSRKQAEKLYIQQEQNFRQLEAAIREKYS